MKVKPLENLQRVNGDLFMNYLPLDQSYDLAESYDLVMITVDFNATKLKSESLKFHKIQLF